MEKGISLTTLRRLPGYLSFLRSLPDPEAGNISSKAIAEALGTAEIQVRKDLASVDAVGKPRVGYRRAALIRALEEALGWNNSDDAVLVGAGRLGRALMDYGGFQDFGLNIVAGFDKDWKALGSSEGGKPILPLEKLPEMIRRMHIHIGIITVPAKEAQGVCDLLVHSGVPAIWNFSPVHLTAPEGTLIQNENMAASLAVLRMHLERCGSSVPQRGPEAPRAAAE